jgi:hypothetical protein
MRSSKTTISRPITSARPETSSSVGAEGDGQTCSVSAVRNLCPPQRHIVRPHGDHLLTAAESTIHSSTSPDNDATLVYSQRRAAQEFAAPSSITDHCTTIDDSCREIPAATAGSSAPPVKSRLAIFRRPISTAIPSPVRSSVVTVEPSLPTTSYPLLAASEGQKLQQTSDLQSKIGGKRSGV